MTSPAYRRVGLIQFLLAFGFVVWLVFFPGFARSFAWPIGSRVSAMFIGASFALRAFEGFFMWREAYWSRLRWMSWGTMAFLVIIFAATFWHVDQINWTPLNPMAVIWVIAYTAEPLVIPFVEPHTGNPGGPGRLLSASLQTLLIVVMFVAAIAFGLLFINPLKFIANYWPWTLTAFDARVLSAFFAGILFWAARMKSLDDWPAIRMGMQGLILFFGAHFLVWLFNFFTGGFEPARTLGTGIYGLVAALMTGALVFFYLRHERT